MTIYGYTGKILYVNLTTNRTWIEPLDPVAARKHIGGTGLAAYLMKQYSFAEINPLGPENPLIFSTGPLTGTNVPTSGRYAVAAKSPLTGIWGESDSGGNFGIKLKSAGYDALVILGRSDAPVKLIIDESKVKIEKAGGLWGLDSYDTFYKLQEDFDTKIGAVCIGPAGEKEIPMANIMSEGKHARAAGRCGLGAVMGSKKLKAVACTGEIKPDIADKKALQESIKKVAKKISSEKKRLKELGTAGGVVGNAVLGDMSARNWREGDWSEPAQAISGEVFKNQFVTGNYHCPTCIIGCGKTVRVKSGPYSGMEAAIPEYETIAGFGAQTLVTDPAVIVEINDLCNRQGLDTISASSTIAFFFEAVEKGIIAPPGDIPGITWGNGEVVIHLLNLILEGKGIGAILQKGVKNAALSLGSEAEHYAIHCKGLEFPYHDPRAFKSLAVAYATSPRGACHRLCTHNLERFPVPELGYTEVLDRFEEKGKGLAAAKMQDYADIYNCLKLCQFVMSAVEISDITAWLNAVTGWDMTQEELLMAGQRNILLKRIFNIACGITSKDDALPYRITAEPFKAGSSAGQVINLSNMLEEYYNIRGWNENGIPREEILLKFGLLEEWEKQISKQG